MPNPTTIIVAHDLDPAQIVIESQKVYVQPIGDLEREVKFIVGDANCPQEDDIVFLLVDEQGDPLTGHKVDFYRAGRLKYEGVNKDYQFDKEQALLHIPNYPLEQGERIIIKARPAETTLSYQMGTTISTGTSMGFPYSLDIIF